MALSVAKFRQAFAGTFFFAQFKFNSQRAKYTKIPPTSGNKKEYSKREKK